MVPAEHLSEVTAATNSALQTIAYQQLPAFGGGGYGVAFDAASSDFAVSATTGLTLVREGSWTTVGSIPLSVGVYTRVAVDAYRDRGFVTGGAGGDLYEVNLTTLSLIATLKTSGNVEGLAVDPSQALLVYCNGTGVSFFDYVTGAPPVTIPMSAGTDRVAIDTQHHLVGVSVAGTIALLNESTRHWWTNATVVSPLLVTYDPVSHEFISGSNGVGEISIFSALHPGIVSNLTVPGITDVQDAALSGSNSDELLIWGNEQLDVLNVTSSTFLQEIVPSPGLSFPYGIATDPATHVALGVDPSSGYDYPFQAIGSPTYRMVLFSSGTPFGGGGYGVAFDAHHGTFDVVSSNGLQVVNETGWLAQGSISSTLGKYPRVAIDSGRQVGFITGGTAGDVYIYNTSTLSVTRTLTTGGAATEGLAVDSSRHLLVYSNGSSISFFNYLTLASPTTIPTTPQTPVRIALDPVRELVLISEDSGNVGILNESTHHWVTNVSVTASNLPIAYDNLSGEVITADNAADEVSLFQEQAPNPVTNVSTGVLTNVQDMCTVGGGSDELLMWGDSSLAVYAVNNQTTLQSLTGSGNFPYGIAIDPSTLTALGVDPVAGEDYPYYGHYTAPSPATGVTASGGNGTFTVSWTPSVTAGVSNYSVEFGGSPTSLPNIRSMGGTTPSSVTLPWTNGVTVYARVLAWEGAVPSAGSSPLASAAPGAIPYPAQNLSAKPTNGTLDLSWNAPASDGGWPVLNYSIGVGTAPGNLAWSWSTGGVTTSISVQGLANGVAEYASVRAWNQIGGSNPTATSGAVPLGEPYPVTSVSLIPGNGSVVVEWSPPVANGGDPISNYSVGVGPSASSIVWQYSTGSSAVLNVTVSSLTNGVPEFASVRAWNSVGGSTPSKPLSAVPVAPPFPVQNVQVLAGNSSLSISWGAPASDGGSSILNYSVGTGPSATSLVWNYSTDSGSQRSISISRLADGVPLFFSIRAWNDIGGSSPSTPQTGLPRGVPYPVTGLALTPGNDSLVVSWGQPIENGGAPISAFWVSYGTSESGPLVVGRELTPCGCSMELTGLEDGRAYYVSVRAQNAAGNGSATPDLVGVPQGVPYPPQGLSASLVSASSANVSWFAPEWIDGSTLTGYVLEYEVGASGPTETKDLPPSTQSFLLGSLASGSTYAFRVAAVNAVGQGNFSGWVSVRTPTSTLSTSQILESPWGVLLIVAILVIAILCSLVLVRRRRRKEGSGRTGPAPSAGRSDVVAPTPSAGWSALGATMGSSDDVSNSYGNYPLEPLVLDHDDSIVEPPGASPQPTLKLSQMTPYVLTVGPEGIHVEAIPRRSDLASGAGASSAGGGQASSTIPPPPPEEPSAEEAGRTGRPPVLPRPPVAGPAGLGSTHPPPVTGSDAYAVLGTLQQQPRSLDGIKQLTRVEDDLLLVLLGAMIRAKLVTRSSQGGSVSGWFTLTPAGRAFLLRGLPPGETAVPPTVLQSSRSPLSSPPSGAPTAAPFGGELLNRGPAEMPASQAVVLHLGMYQGHLHEAVVPPQVTQAGIAQALGTTPNSVAVTLKRLEESGVVRVDLRHVSGGRRRLKAYFLTDKGLQFRAQLINSGAARRGGPPG